jgi:hypothetical protein
MAFEELRHGPNVPGWGLVGSEWAKKQQPADDAVGRGEVRWGANVNFELNVLDGKSGVLIQQSAVPILVSEAQTLIQTPRVPERVWELTLGMLWPNPAEGRQAPANGIKMHASFRVNFGIGSMQQTIVLGTGGGINPTTDPVTTSRPFETTGLIEETWDILGVFTTGALVSASEMGVGYINAANFNIEGFVWAENLPGAPFAPPARIMHVTLYCGVSPYTRGART